MSQLRPRLKIDVKEAISLQAQAGPGIVAIMGTAIWGPVGEVQTLTSFSQALEAFKDDKTGTTETISLIKGLDLLYGNGAGTVLALRVGDGAEAKATETFDASTTPVITIDGKYEGTHGNNIGVTITANSTTPANRDVEITDGTTTEVFNNGGAGYSDTTDLVADINASSTITTATKLSSTVPDAITQTFLTGGLDGESSLISSDYTTPFDSVLTNEDFDILVIPGSDSLEASDSFQATFLGKLNTRASSEDKFAIFVSGIAKDETIPTAQARTSSGQRLTIVSPNVKSTHRIDGDQKILNGSYLACAYAGGMAGRDVESSPTHKTLNVEGVSVLESSGKDFYNNGEQEQLLSASIVPITSIRGSIQASRGVTTESDTTSIFYEQNIVRIVDFVKAQVLDTLNPFIGDPNLSRVREVMSKEVDGILEQDKLDEVIVDFLPTEVDEGSSPDTVVVNMTIQPTFAINFINVSLTIDRT